MTMTAQELDEIARRLSKGWVIRRDEIEALIAMARGSLAVKEGMKPADPNAHASHTYARTGP